MQLERWPQEEIVTGLAKDTPLALKGGIVLRVTLVDVTKKKSKEILVRAKILASGTSSWHGLILGGRALDHADRGGLGFRPGPMAHVLESVGILLPRTEEREGYSDKAYPMDSRIVSSVYSAFEEGWDAPEGRGPFPMTGDVLVCAEATEIEPEVVGEWVRVARVGEPTERGHGAPGRLARGRGPRPLVVRG